MTEEGRSWATLREHVRAHGVLPSTSDSWSDEYLRRFHVADHALPNHVDHAPDDLGSHAMLVDALADLDRLCALSGSRGEAPYIAARLRHALGTLADDSRQS